MKTKILLFLLASLLLGLLSCSNSVLKKINSPWKDFVPPPSYLYISSGSLKTSMGDIEVTGFFMSETEVSNSFYNQFLADLKKEGRTEDYNIAKRQPEKWNREEFQKKYHTDPVYGDYPVLTISKEGAILYCKWLEKIWQSKYPNFNVNIRLPLEFEWVYAALGGHEDAPYPWGGYGLRNSKGLFLANFKRLNSSNISYDRKTQTYAIKAFENTDHNYSKPAPVVSYLPNDYGLFHMSGNAAEMVSTKSLKKEGGNRTMGGCYDSTGWDIQIEGRDEFEGWTEPSQYIGFRPVIDVTPK